jgi:hypothetical protein
MAHTLKIYDGVEGTTLDLAATAATGYHLLSYPFATQPTIEERKTSSQYQDGELPYYDRRNNIAEEITIEVTGSTRDDLWAKIRALFRAMENARDYFRAPGIRTCTYLEFKPDGTTNSGYSAIMGGRVELPHLIPGAPGETAEGAEGEYLAHTISGGRIVLEREPFWRAYAPQTLPTPAAGREEIKAIEVNNTFEQITFDKTSYGDIPALVRLTLTSAAPPSLLHPPSWPLSAA